MNPSAKQTPESSYHQSFHTPSIRIFWSCLKEPWNEIHTSFIVVTWKCIILHHIATYKGQEPKQPIPCSHPPPLPDITVGTPVPLATCFRYLHSMWVCNIRWWIWHHLASFIYLDVMFFWLDVVDESWYQLKEDLFERNVCWWFLSNCVYGIRLSEINIGWLDLFQNWEEIPATWLTGAASSTAMTRGYTSDQRQWQVVHFSWHLDHMALQPTPLQ